VLADGSRYGGGVFYCKDAFDGLAVMDRLTDADQRATLLAEYQRGAGADEGAGRPTSRPSNGRAAERSAIRPVASPPRPPFLGPHRLEAVTLEQAWAHLDLNTLFRHHWGAWKARERYGEIVEREMKPTLEALQAEVLQRGWLESLIVYGYFPVAADGDELIVFDPADPARETARLRFPRQPEPPFLCLADYYLPRDAAQRDLVAFQVVSAGPRPGEVAESLEQQGDYSKGYFLRGLASSTAEALAEVAHGRIRRELGLAADQGKRYSWGYPACPDLSHQVEVLRLLDAERAIGVVLTESFQLVPEHSTAAIVVHHPEAAYFAVRG
jgi:5-methyltetrahydrofolate--homocysteine methyltransferase